MHTAARRWETSCEQAGRLSYPLPRGSRPRKSGLPHRASQYGPVPGSVGKTAGSLLVSTHSWTVTTDAGDRPRKLLVHRGMEFSAQLLGIAIAPWPDPELPPTVFEEDIEPDAIVMRPALWETIEDEASTEFASNSNQPAATDAMNRRLYGIPVMVTNSATAGEAIVGDFQGSARIFRTGSASVTVHDSQPRDVAGTDYADYRLNQLVFRGDARRGCRLAPGRLPPREQPELMHRVGGHKRVGVLERPLTHLLRVAHSSMAPPLLPTRRGSDGCSCGVRPSDVRTASRVPQQRIDPSRVSRKRPIRRCRTRGLAEIARWWLAAVFRPRNLCPRVG